ncbi:MAG TPA: hypothetical protein VGU61_22375, partial [Noviherbaspirillum sp.]|uniref:hypothetical protein n=1 Tax=Noviherbaspirillum sp. TaxID=1926288 RepID=UPI002DDD25C2
MPPTELSRNGTGLIAGHDIVWAGRDGWREQNRIAMHFIARGARRPQDLGTPARPSFNTNDKEDWMQERRLRLLFIISALWGMLIFWVAPHPPMVDLPQHAGQVVLLKQMLLGDSPWSEQLRINLFTPYIIGYGLALPLSLLMPVAAALKLLLSAAYIAFVCMCIALRRQFGGDARLDWLFLLSFFGFAYTWGFFTFLIASPIGLYFILQAERYAVSPDRSRGAMVVLIGLLMLASHGLVFLFATAVGAAILAARVRWFTPLLKAAWPYILLAFACGAYFLINQRINAGLQTGLEQGTRWNWDALRRLPLLYTVAAGTQRSPSTYYWAIVLLFAAAPWLMGLRIHWRRSSSWIAFVIVASIIIVVPHFAMNTAFLYERFALFLAPAYAWMFNAKPQNDALPAARNFSPPRCTGVVFLLMIACWTMFAVHTSRAWHFARESAEFDAVLSALEPGQRALSLIYNRDSAAANTNNLYLHYPLWYQAE